ncbi:MAG: cupin domain-containing protein [Clostridiales bacterium]|nr:cupin domain-containing protein [Clostridiales bacterium]
MIKVNWRDVVPTIAHDAGIDWRLLSGQSLKDENDPSACMEGMMYIARACLQPSLSYHPHAHDDHEEVYYIIRGKGEIRIDDEVQPIRDGDIIYIGVNQVHEIRNTGDEMMEFLAVGAQV